MRREERIARQDDDPGAGDETVYAKPSNNGSGGRSYHDDPGCKRLQQALEDGDRPVEKSRTAAQRRWWGPCSSCVTLVESGGLDEARTDGGGPDGDSSADQGGSA